MSRNAERGATLMTVLISLSAMAGVAGVAILSARSEVSTSGHSRFQQAALYAAESGVAASMAYLRTSCTTGDMFSDVVEPNNENPQSPADILGNHVPPGQAGNPFDQAGQLWYDVTILNNVSDPGLADGDDMDAILLVRSVGHGPDGTSATVEVEIQNSGCLATTCEQAYAQRGSDAMNDSTAVCGGRIASGASNSYTIGGP